MDNGLIPSRYAKALYKFAKEKGKTEELYDKLKVVIKSFEENPSLQKVLSNPFVNGADKEKLLVAAAGGDDTGIYEKFVKLIIEQKRTEYAYRIMLAYRDIYRKENNISQVNITTAVELEEEQMKKLEALVRSSFKNSTLEFTHAIKPELIGGFIIDVDSVRMDASISNEIEQLRQTLLSSK